MVVDVDDGVSLMLIIAWTRRSWAGEEGLWVGREDGNEATYGR